MTEPAVRAQLAKDDVGTASRWALAELQWGRLAETVAHAHVEVPFYREAFEAATKAASASA